MNIKQNLKKCNTMTDTERIALRDRGFQMIREYAELHLGDMTSLHIEENNGTMEIYRNYFIDFQLKNIMEICHAHHLIMNLKAEKRKSLSDLNIKMTISYDLKQEMIKELTELKQ